MDTYKLTCLSPLDGRYNSDIETITPIFSEFGLMKFRILVEINWLLTLVNHPQIGEINNIDIADKQLMMDIYRNFTLEDAEKIKLIEQKTQHDVKAIEYFIKEKCQNNNKLEPLLEFIHFACTSEDINNLAYALMLKSGLQSTIIPKMQQLVSSIVEMAEIYATIPMLSRTHGQTASPTTVGKEMANFAYRLQQQLSMLQKVKFLGKINGAVGNYNAHHVAYPEINWPDLAKNFIEQQLELTYNPYTTQIEPHDYMASIFNIIQQFNTILIDFNRDIWGYISLGYFTQKTIAGEVGSSTMPHKVNPINFENSEGNLGISNAMLQHFSAKLPISRWQRDLTDSTVLRNVGVALGYGLVAYNATIKGITKLKINQQQLQNDLQQSWEVIAEAIQTVMRRHGIANPYEQLKQLTRGVSNITSELLYEFIDKLDLPQAEKTQLQQLTPSNYIGYAASQANNIVANITKSQTDS